MISETIYEERPYVSKRIKSPCKNCSKRYVGCSAHCDDYKQFKREWEEAKKWLDKDKNAEYTEFINDKYTNKLQWRKRKYGK